jgi:hypothetical protein
LASDILVGMTPPKLALALTAAGLIGGLVGGVAVGTTVQGDPGQRGQQGARGPQGPAGSDAPKLKGAYVLVDSGAPCPARTVAVNAEVSVATNAASGRSPFGLCFIK